MVYSSMFIDKNSYDTSISLASDITMASDLIWNMISENMHIRGH